MAFQFTLWHLTLDGIYEYKIKYILKFQDI